MGMYVGGCTYLGLFFLFLLVLLSGDLAWKARWFVRSPLELGIPGIRAVGIRIESIQSEISIIPVYQRQGRGGCQLIIVSGRPVSDGEREQFLQLQWMKRYRRAQDKIGVGGGT